MIKLETTQGLVAVQDSGGGAPVVVFLHGNSASKEIFAAQWESPLRDRYRLVLLDLPGHGDSEDARDPHQAYTIAGYASVVREVLGQLGIAGYLVVGWSLGGHIAIELLASEPRPLGVVITGTPPFAKNLASIGEAFVFTPDMQLTSKPDFTDEEALTYARATTTPTVNRDDARYRAVRRTDGRARARMFAAAGEGVGVDQCRTVEEVPVPLAIINGQQDGLINHAYFAKPHYAKLWRGAVQQVAAAHHAPFFEKPDVYNDLLQHFFAEVVSAS